MSASTVSTPMGANLPAVQEFLNPIIVDIVDTALAQVGMDDQSMDLGFVTQNVQTPFDTIESMVGPEPLKKVNEGGTLAQSNRIGGWVKGYKLDEFGLEYSCTLTLSKWIENAVSDPKISPEATPELVAFKDNVRNLTLGAALTKSELIARVLANGFSVTAAYGPGSAMGDGKALFATDHVVKAPKPGKPATFSNLIPTGASAPLSQANLEAAIQKFKTEIVCPNGYAMKTPSVYTLVVSMANETAARKILNSAGDQAGIYAGTANNANLLNVFSFQGSKVKLVVLDMLGQPGSDGTVIGDNDMWFLMNNEYNVAYKSFRYLSLWDKNLLTWFDYPTRTYKTSMTSYIGADAFNFEGIIGSTGKAA